MPKKIKYLLFLIALIVIYLFASHFYIYKIIRMAGLKAVDDRHRYEINQNSQNKMIYVSLGDSLTSGAGADKYEESYPYLLAARLSASDKHVINLNFSYPGARTADVIRDLLPKAIIEQPDLVTLLIGTNDIHGNVSFSETIKNYDFILQELKAKTKAKVNVISVPFIGSQTLLLPPYNWYFENKVLSLNREILILCNKYGFHYIDLTTPTAEISREDGIYYSADKFHPAATGYKMWSNIIYDNINQ